MRDKSRRKKGKASAIRQGEIGEHLETYAGLSEGTGMKTHLHGPMGFAKTLELRFRVRELDPLERRKRYTSIREEEVNAQMCPCGEAIE